LKNSEKEKAVFKIQKNFDYLTVGAKQKCLILRLFLQKRNLNW